METIEAILGKMAASSQGSCGREDHPATSSPSVSVISQLGLVPNPAETLAPYPRANMRKMEVRIRRISFNTGILSCERIRTPAD